MRTVLVMRRMILALSLLVAAMVSVPAEAGRWIPSSCTECTGKLWWVVFVEPGSGNTEKLANTLIGQYGGYLRAVWPDGKFAVEATEAEARAMLADARVTLVDGRKERYFRSRLPAATPALGAAPEVGTNVWTTGVYQYDGAGNIKAIGADTFQYDGVGRLTQAALNHAGEAWQQSAVYDPFGNRLTATTVRNGAQSATALDPDPATNRLRSAAGLTYTYDAAGNVTQAGSVTLTYDALGMVVERTDANGPTMRYLYTANDERLATINVNSGETHWTIRGLDHKVLSEFVSTTPTSEPRWTKSYIWADGVLLQAVTPEGTIHYHTDHLGTPRLLTDGSGDLISEHKYLPFGEEMSEAGAETLKFTGHERDQGNVDRNDLDYLHARYYNPNLGRFLSVDPGRDWDPKQPQSWNSYAYVRNNPLGQVDPNGRNAVVVGELGAVFTALYLCASSPACSQEVIQTGVSAWNLAMSLKDAADDVQQEQVDGEVVIDGNKYPESGQHVQDAQDAGQPAVITVDRGGAKGRRQESMQGTPRQPGKDRDEYPPAVAQEGGKGSSVRPVTPKDNRGAGASLGNQLRAFKDGAKVAIRVVWNVVF